MTAQKRLSSQERYKLLKRVIDDGVSVSQACREAGVSRFTFYKWLRRYQESQVEGKDSCLDRNRKGRNHWKFPSKRVLELVFEIVREHPEFSNKRINKEIAVRGEAVKISPHGIHSILARFGLSTFEKRDEYARRFKERSLGKIVELSPDERLSLMEMVRGGVGVSEVCKLLGISRNTFYKWQTRYASAREGRELDALVSQRPVGKLHWKGVGGPTIQRVLDTVLLNPALSARQISREVGGISQHGVHNVLLREGLNTIDKRVAWTREQEGVDTAVRPEVSWGDRPKLAVPEFVPTLAPAPPPGIPTGFLGWLRQPSRFLSSLIFFFIFVSGLYGWGYLLGTADSTGQRIGFFFASIALAAGTIFFLYSLKYYLTLAFVLSFSRDMGEQGELAGTKTIAGRGIISFIAKLFGIDVNVSGKGSIAADKSSLQSSSQIPFSPGLDPELGNIKLERKPFISVHLPLFNEKRVAERLLRACTAFDWYTAEQGGEALWEVVVADDSTDETTAIVQQFADQWNSKLKSKNLKPQLKTQKPIIKVVHRDTRDGFKGAALNEALNHTDDRAEFIVVFDADFVPYPDTLELFVKSFQKSAGSLHRATKKDPTPGPISNQGE